MTNPNKVKGTRWERDACKLLNKHFPGVWKRIAMSGALGTMLGIPILRADAIGEYKMLDRRIVAEAKVGYGGKQMRIQKAWFDHIQEVADSQYAVPIVLLKFEKSRSGIKHIACMSFETWDYFMEELQDAHDEINKLHKLLEEKGNA